MSDDDIIRRVAKAMWCHDNPDHPHWQDKAWSDMGGSEPTEERVEYELRALDLHKRGLLAPGTLSEAWSAAYYAADQHGRRHLRLIGTDGDRVHAQETRDDCAKDDPDTRFFLARCLFYTWEEVD